MKKFLTIISLIMVFSSLLGVGNANPQDAFSQIQNSKPLSNNDNSNPSTIAEITLVDSTWTVYTHMNISISGDFVASLIYDVNGTKIDSGMNIWGIFEQNGSVTGFVDEEKYSNSFFGNINTQGNGLWEVTNTHGGYMFGTMWNGYCDSLESCSSPS